RLVVEDLQELALGVLHELEVAFELVAGLLPRRVDLHGPLDRAPDADDRVERDDLAEAFGQLEGEGAGVELGVRPEDGLLDLRIDAFHRGAPGLQRWSQASSSGLAGSRLPSRSRGRLNRVRNPRANAARPSGEMFRRAGGMLGRLSSHPG